MGISGLPTDMTRRRLEVGDGERRWQRGRGGGGSTSASALSAAWLAAARWLRRALAAAPRLRWRRRPAWLPGAGGEDGEVETGVGVEGPASSSIANLTLVLPPLVEIVRLVYKFLVCGLIIPICMVRLVYNFFGLWPYHTYLHGEIPTLR